jgi:hypothetical protein|tara:strand:- start:289 stop:537 length:249 start_codon:yes stop_codon:yes gene_type:complete
VNRLVVSTTMWVIYWIHCNTTDGWIEFSSRLLSIMGSTCLHQRFVGSAMATEYPNRSTAGRWKIFQTATWHSDSYLIAHPSF